MISGEMWSVTVERGFFSRDIWPFLLLCPSAIFFLLLLTISFSFLPFWSIWIAFSLLLLLLLVSF